MILQPWLLALPERCSTLRECSQVRATRRVLAQLWSRLLVISLLSGWCALFGGFPKHASAQMPLLQERATISSIDGTLQPFRYWLPNFEAGRSYPVLVSLHSWSADYTQDRGEWLREAQRRNWVYLQPNFRGVNQTPAACGSLRARWDILDAIDWAVAECPIDQSRIYLCGVSGGGHMTMLMAAYHPERFSAATAWVGISDLAEWYRFHTPEGIEARYATMIAACCGGSPGTSAAVDLEYYRRSPIPHLHHARELPLDLNTGVHDGKTGSVPIHQTLRAYNAVVRATNGQEITESEMDALWELGHWPEPLPSELTTDPTYPREALFRRSHGPTRVTVFEGGHEALPSAACQWLEQQLRPTRRPSGEQIP